MKPGESDWETEQGLAAGKFGNGGAGRDGELGSCSWELGLGSWDLGGSRGSMGDGAGSCSWVGEMEELGRKMLRRGVGPEGAWEGISKGAQNIRA